MATDAEVIANWKAFQASQKANPVSDTQVKDWLDANPNASDAEIVAAAQSAGVDAEQLSRVTGVDKKEVETRINDVVDPVVNEIKSAYTTFLDRDADTDGLDYWTNQVATGALTLDQAKLAIATSEEAKTTDPVKAATASLYGQVLQRAPDEEGLNYFADEIQSSLDSGVDADTVLRNVATSLVNSEEKKTQNVQYTAGLIDQAKAGDINAYGELLYLSRKSDTPIPTQLIEQIGYSRSDNKTDAYNYSVGAQGVAEGLEALDQARASGDTAKAAEIESALANPDTYWDYYNNNIAEKEGQAHINLRKETADGNPFEIGDPGEYQTSFFERIGDIGQDILENPVFKMAFALNPATAPFAPFLSAVTTKLSGDEISGLQVAGMLASAPGAFSQASTLAGTQYDTGFLSPQSIELATQQVGLEPNWLTLGQDVSSGITTESDLLRGAQQGGVMAGATALGGGSNLDIAKAFANQQMIDLGLEGMLSNPNISGAIGSLQGLGIDLNALKEFSLPEIANINIPGLDLSLGDIEANLPFDLGQLKTIAGALPDFNLPSANLPEFDVTLPQLSGIDIPNINIPSIDLPSAPNFNFNMQGPSGPDFNVDIPDVDLPMLTRKVLFTPGTPMIDNLDVVRGGRGMFGSDEEEVKRISELLLAGVSQPLTIG